MIAVSTTTWVVAGIAAVIGLGGLGLIAKNIREIVKLRLEKTGAQPLLGRPPQVTRRVFFRRTMFMGFGLANLGFAAGSLAFLWPNLRGGFGGKVKLAASLDEVKSQIATDRKPFYFAPGRFYLVAYDVGGANNPYVKEGTTAAGLMALYQRCVHLGCRVPFCATSQWFECPCHGSKYNRAGEYQAGPAPRGLDRFPITVVGSAITVDTGLIFTGPARGSDTTGQQPEGPFCVEQVREHK